MSAKSDEWRTSPLYSIAEAAHLAQVSTRTVKRWLYGDDGIRPMYSVFDSKPEEEFKSPLVLSFLQLAEIVVATKFRQRGVTLDRVRRAHKYAKLALDLEYPFATLKLETLGGYILRRFEEDEPGASLLVLSASNQWTLPGIVIETFHNFDYEVDLAARWFPFGKTVPIVIDPRYASGVPTIPNRGVTIHAIKQRFKAGQSIRLISQDLRLSREQVEEALRYADKIAA